MNSPSVNKIKTSRKKQPKELSIDVVMEKMTLEVPEDQSDTMDLINELPVDVKPEAKPKRARKTKVQEIQDVEYQHPGPVVEAEKEVVSAAKKPSNPWIDHIRAFAKEHNLTYNKAMLHGDLKKTYVKVVTSKNTVSVP